MPQWGRRRTPKAESGHSAVADPLAQSNISFGNFDFQESKNLGQRGGGVRELSSLLRHARRQADTHQELLRSRWGVEERSHDLLSSAVQRASGLKVKDDPQKLTKALAKRRSKKRQSAKRWAQRLKNLESSVENVVKDRSVAKQTIRARKEAKQRGKEQRKAAIKGGGAGKKGAKKDSKSGQGVKRGGSQSRGGGGGRGRGGGGRGRGGRGKR